MSELVFMTGLGLSAIAMFVLMAVWNRRAHAPTPGPVRLKLGSPLAWQSLVAALGGFVGGILLIGLLAVTLEHTLEQDGALYAMWAIPWIIPPMLPLARWGLDVAAPGEIELDEGRIRVSWGAERLDVLRSEARIRESIARAPEGGLWQVHIEGGRHTVVIRAPFRGFFGVKALDRLHAAGVPDAPPDPAGLNVVADLHEVLALRRALLPDARE